MTPTTPVPDKPRTETERNAHVDAALFITRWLKGEFSEAVVADNDGLLLMNALEEAGFRVLVDVPPDHD